MTPPAPPADAVPALLADILAELRARNAPPPLMLAAKDAAELLGIGQTSFYAAVSGGDLPKPCDTPGGPRWKRSDLERWVERLKPRHRARRAIDVTPSVN